MRGKMGLFGFALMMVVFAGCGEEAPMKKEPGKKPEGKTSRSGKETKIEVAKGDGKHEGWWCDEHGIKEEDCSMCNAKVAKAFQDKNDWCKLHDRAKSQCFICDPKLQELFAVEYKAKFGKAPPEPDGQKPETN